MRSVRICSTISATNERFVVVSVKNSCTFLIWATLTLLSAKAASKSAGKISAALPTGIDDAVDGSATLASLPGSIPSGIFGNVMRFRSRRCATSEALSPLADGDAVGSHFAVGDAGEFCGNGAVGCVVV